MTPEMPTPLARVGNFLTAVVNTARDGFRATEWNDATKRSLVCFNCELLRRSDWVCQHPACGCFIELKVRVRSERCPLGKWPEPGAEPDPNQPAPAPCDC